MTTTIEVRLRWHGNHLLVGNIVLALIFKTAGNDFWKLAHCTELHPTPTIPPTIRCEKAFRQEVELWAIEALGAKPT